jgi:hypothetical protein
MQVANITEGTEARQILFVTRTEIVRSLDPFTANGHVVELEEVLKRIRSKAKCQ